MKKPIKSVILVLLLILPAVLFSQSNTTLEKGQDLFNQGMEKYNNQQYSQAERIFIRALAVYEDIPASDYESTGYSKESYLASAYAWIAECSRIQELFSEALPHYQKAEDLSRESGDEFTASIYRGNKGVCLLALDNYIDAEKALLGALEMAEYYQQPYYQAFWHSHLAELYIDWEKYEIARKHGEAGVDLAIQANQEYLWYLAETNLAQTLYMLDEDAEAEEHYKESWEWASSYNYLEGLATIAENYGTMLVNQARYDEALPILKTGLSYYESIENPGETASFNNMIGYLHDGKGEYKKALSYFETAREIALENNLESELSSALGNIGSVYHHEGDLTQAISYYREALDKEKESEDIRGEAIYYSNIANIYETWGYYDFAYKNYIQAVEIARREEFFNDLPGYLNNLANLMTRWGRYGDARALLLEALDIAEQINLKDSVATINISLGVLNEETGNFTEAMDNFQNALEIAEQTGNEIDKALIALNIASLYSEEGNNEKALETYLISARKFEENSILDHQGTCYNNIAAILQDMERYEEAAEYYTKTLEVDQILGNMNRMITTYSNIGNLYYSMDNYDDAESYYWETLDLLDMVLETAPPDSIRDLRAANIMNYQNLMYLYNARGDVNSALNMFEYYTATRLTNEIERDSEELRNLLEQQNQGRITSEPDVLEEGEARIICAGFNREEGLEFLLVRDELFITTIRKYWIAEQIEEKIGYNMDSVFSRTPSLERLQIKDTAVSSRDERFDQYILYYRYLLSRPFLPRRQQEDLEYLAKTFYSIFIDTQLQELGGITDLTIIREGTLAFLPFETLISPEGRYLVEDYSISYAVSLTVNDYIQERSRYSSSESLLAFGGAIYKEKTYEEDISVSDDQLAALRNSVTGMRASTEGTTGMVRESEGERGSAIDTSDVYRALNYDQWENLPGTLTEVQAIQELIPGSTVFTGERVSESMIQEFQETGKLKEYRTIHFATHGIVIPEIPELSSLVLSFEGENSTSDGYLTAGEISQLDLNADFVNLSACQTGLGRVYPGEGVAGLIHAFLVAGANGLCASLWSVSDASTMEFMVGLYAKTAQELMSYSEAINEMKREFIRSGEFSSPYYWAPFQYYGIK